jgi:hypothetical protein
MRNKMDAMPLKTSRLLDLYEIAPLAQDNSIPWNFYPLNAIKEV